MDTRIVTTDADFDALAPAWLALEEADPDLPPQLTHAYVAAWVRQRGDARLHVVVAEDHGELVGVLPLVVEALFVRNGPSRRLDLGKKLCLEVGVAFPANSSNADRLAAG